MEINEQKVDEMSLSLLYLTTFKDKFGFRAWKSHGWDVLDRLYENAVAVTLTVYQRTAAGWQIIASAVSVIPYADLEPQPVDPKVLDTYLGVWQDTPAPSTVTLSRDGRKLIAQGSNETGKTKLLALSDNVFVMRGDPSLITFEKGPDGKVTRTILHDLGGSVQVHERAMTDRKH